MAFTKVVGPGIHTLSNITSHNVHSSGIITATRFDGPFTNLNVTGVTTFAGNVSIGGTLTYEDVTNIDSVGLVTARDGIFLPDNKKAEFGNVAGTADFEIAHDTNNTVLQNRTGGLYFKGLAGGGNAIYMQPKNNESSATFHPDGAVDLFFNNTKRFETTNTGAIVTGILTATNGLDAIGIQSGGVNISTGILTAINFIGLGNTFAVNGTTVDVSISGNSGAGGTWSSYTAGIATTKSIGINTNNLDNNDLTGEYTTSSAPSLVSSNRILLLDANSYSGSGNWLDTSGSNNHGTLYSSGSGLTYVNDGNTDYFNFANDGTSVQNYFKFSSALFNPNADHTFSIWVRFTDTSTSSNTYQAFCTKWDAQGGMLYRYRHDTGSNFGLNIVRSHQSNIGYFNNSDNLSSGTIWNFTFTRSGNTFTAYINGVNTHPVTGNTLGTVTSSDTSFQQPNAVGTDYNTDDIEGRVYHVMAYSDALTASEVLQNFNSLKERYGYGSGGTSTSNRFQGLYISNGMMITDNTLNGNHYIGTAFNGLMAGPVNIEGTLTIDGNYVVV